MKMISRQYKKRVRQKTIQKFILIVFFISFIIFLNATDRNPFTGLAHFLSIPALRAENIVKSKIVDFAKVFRSKQSLVKENNDLKQRLIETEGTEALNSSLKEENLELKHLLGRDVADNFVLASVVTRPNTSIYDTLIIDVGARDGIHVDDNVVVLGDFLVGFVSKVFTKSAQVTLFSSPGERTNVIIGENDIRAVAVGKGAGNFTSELPRDLEISKGDIITLVGLNVQVFGEVESITRTEADAFQVILFKNPVNIFTIKSVQVIRSNFEI